MTCRKFRLRAVTAEEPARGQNNPEDDAPSLVPALKARHCVSRPETEIGQGETLHPTAEKMLQPDLAAVWQKRDQHRNAATVGTVDPGPSSVTKKRSSVQAFSHTPRLPSSAAAFPSSDRCRQKRDDEPAIDRVTHEGIGAGVYDLMVLLAGDHA